MVRTHTIYASSLTIVLSAAAVLCAPRAGYAQAQPSQPKVARVARLQARIEPAERSGLTSESAVGFAAMVTNIGTAPNAAGRLRIVCLVPAGTRGDIKENGQGYWIKFTTEARPLPILHPGKSVHITFEATHDLPSIVEFVHENYLAGSYQARATIGGGDEIVLGTQGLSVKYEFQLPEGTTKEQPHQVPAQQAPTLKPIMPTRPLRPAPTPER